jgi:hypothetical protein
MHETLNKGRAFYLKNSMFSMQREEGKSIFYHLLKLNDIRNQWLAIGQEVIEDDMMMTPSRFKTLTHSLENFVETLNITSESTDTTFADHSCNLSWQTFFRDNYIGEQLC